MRSISIRRRRENVCVLRWRWGSDPRRGSGCFNLAVSIRLGQVNGTCWLLRNHHVIMGTLIEVTGMQGRSRPLNLRRWAQFCRVSVIVCMLIALDVYGGKERSRPRLGGRRQRSLIIVFGVFCLKLKHMKLLANLRGRFRWELTKFLDHHQRSDEFKEMFHEHNNSYRYRLLESCTELYKNRRCTDWPKSTYRLTRDPCRRLPSLDPLHQLIPIACAHDRSIVA